MPFNKIMRYDKNTYLRAGGLNAAVNSIFKFSGVIYATGTFTDLEGIAYGAGGTTGGMAKWDEPTAAWIMLARFTGADSGGNVIASSGGIMYVGGGFTSVTPVGGGPIAIKLIATFTPPNTWAQTGNGLQAGGAYSMYDDAGTLWIGGSFTQDGLANPLNRIVTWNGVAFTAQGDAVGLSTTVKAITKFNALMTIGIQHDTQFTVLTEGYLRKLSGGLWIKLDGLTNNNVHVLLTRNPGTEELHIGGEFTQCKDLPRYRYTRYTVVSGYIAQSTLTGGNSGLNKGVRAIEEFSSDIYIGGDFTSDPDDSQRGPLRIAKIVGDKILSVPLIGRQRNPNQPVRALRNIT